MVQRSRLVILGVVVIAATLWAFRPHPPDRDDGPAKTALHHEVDCAHVQPAAANQPPGWYVDGARLTRDDLRLCHDLLQQRQASGEGRGLALE